MSSGAINECERRRQALLEELRRSHRAEHAPPELRRRLLDRAGHDAGGPEALRRAFGPELPWRPRSLAPRAASPLVALKSRVVLGALAALALAVALHGTPSAWLGDDAGARAPSPPEIALGPEPRAGTPAGAEPSGRPSASPSEPDARESDAPAPPVAEAVGALSEQPRCPLAALPRGAVLMPGKSGAAGFTAHTFEQELPSCGPLTRRYLELVPPGVTRLSSAPVVILLHDAGEAAESMHSQRSRLDFEGLARRNGFILIYANAAPGEGMSVGVADSGAWQTDRRTHPEIDDEHYLERVLFDLDLRGVIDGSNDVYLAGYGDGAAMALRAAVSRRGRYTGVAAFAPSNLAFVEPVEPRASERLTRVMIVLQVPDRGSGEAWRLSMPMFARRWAAALGVDQKVVGRFWTSGTPDKPLGTVHQLDVALPATGSSGVRIYVIDGAMESLPNAVHAWDFLTGADGAEPDVPEELADLPMVIVPDGHSVLSEDVEGVAHPEVLLDGEVVTAPRRAARPQP